MAKVIDKRTKPQMCKMEELEPGTWFIIHGNPEVFWYLDEEHIIKMKAELIYEYDELLAYLQLKDDTEVTIVKGSIVIEN